MLRPRGVESFLQLRDRITKRIAVLFTLEIREILVLSLFDRRRSRHGVQTTGKFRVATLTALLFFRRLVITVVRERRIVTAVRWLVTTSWGTAPQTGTLTGKQGWGPARSSVAAGGRASSSRALHSLGSRDGLSGRARDLHPARRPLRRQFILDFRLRALLGFRPLLGLPNQFPLRERVSVRTRLERFATMFTTGHRVRVKELPTQLSRRGSSRGSSGQPDHG